MLLLDILGGIQSIVMLDKYAVKLVLHAVLIVAKLKMKQKNFKFNVYLFPLKFTSHDIKM